jgi:hypothetical protein
MSENDAYSVRVCPQREGGFALPNSIELSAAVTTGLSMTAAMTNGVSMTSAMTNYVNIGNVGSTSSVALHFIAAFLGHSIETGTYQSLADGGVILSASNTFNAGFLADDSGSNIGDSVRNVLARTLLTVDQSGGSIRSLMGQLKLLTGVDVTTGIYTGVQGYLEMVGTHSCKTGATFSCIDASAEITTALTVDSGGEFAGIHVETTGAGTITNSGTCAGILIDKASGGASWPEGILIDGPSVIMGMRIGKFAGSAVTTSAVLFSTDQDVYSDGQLSTMEVHGASSGDLTNAYCAKCGRFRHVVSGSSLTIAHETYGLMGQLVVKGSTLNHLHSGLIGTFEGHTSGAVLGTASGYTHTCAAIMARCGGGGFITANSDLCGVLAFWNGAALASGASNAFALDDTGTTVWTNALSLTSCTNLLDLPAAGTDPVIANALVPAVAPDQTTVGADACLRVLVNDVAYYIALYDSLHG